MKKIRRFFKKNTFAQHTCSASIESTNEKLSDIDKEPGEWVLCVDWSGVMVLDCRGSITTLGEILTLGGSRPLLFRPLSPDRWQSRTEVWNRSGILSSEHSSLRKTSGELKNASFRDAAKVSLKAAWEISDIESKMINVGSCCNFIFKKGLFHPIYWVFGVFNMFLWFLSDNWGHI